METTRVDALHVAVLCSVAVAQPLFHLLSRHVEFFTARQSQLVDVLLLILAIIVVLPMCGVAVEWGAGRFGSRIQRAVHLLIVTILVTLIVLPGLNDLAAIPDLLIIAAAVLLGAMAAVGYARLALARRFVTILSPVLVVFPVMFLSGLPLVHEVFQRPSEAIEFPAPQATTPVVLVVFDELPVTSLMDEDRKIDAVRYPHFSALARHAHWFRDTSTISTNTLYTVPAIVTGTYPNDQTRSQHAKSIARAAQYPRNLFAWFDGSYEMKVIESSSDLYPQGREIGLRDRLQERMAALLLDLSVVYLHMILPDGYVKYIPEVNQTWQGFVQFNHDGDGKHVRVAKFDRFLQSIVATNRPTLYFAHLLFPHVPWEYYPSGRRYDSSGFGTVALDHRGEGDRWVNDEGLVTHAFQRHLLQVGFVDTLLGQIINRLRSANLYDRCLLIVTADHGVSFHPGVSWRSITPDTLAQLVAVPLFIKVPYQQEGMIHDEPREILQILPTIADVLEVDVPWSMNARSVFELSSSAREERIVFDFDGQKQFRFSDLATARDQWLDHQIAVFGSGHRSKGLFHIGPHPELIGRAVSDLELVEEQDVHVILTRPKKTWRVSSESQRLPLPIQGQVVFSDTTDEDVSLAISINGTIVAVTQPMLRQGDSAMFLALVPEEAFHAESHEIEIFVVRTKRDGRIQLGRAQ